MTHKHPHFYTYRIDWSEEDSEYVGLCTEFPSLSWLAETPQAALQGIKDLVRDVTNDIRKELNAQAHL